MKNQITLEWAEALAVAAEGKLRAFRLVRAQELIREANQAYKEAVLQVLAKHEKSISNPDQTNIMVKMEKGVPTVVEWEELTPPGSPSN